MICIVLSIFYYTIVKAIDIKIVEKCSIFVRRFLYVAILFDWHDIRIGKSRAKVMVAKEFF